MPQAGNTMEEGRVVHWKVKVGDRIAVGQVIYEVETDKATVEVEATDAGRLRGSSHRKARWFQSNNRSHTWPRTMRMSMPSSVVA